MQITKKNWNYDTNSSLIYITKLPYFMEQHLGNILKTLIIADSS